MTESTRTGTYVGPYLLHEEIGRGGMGSVYRATKTDTGQEVALKLMLPELSASPKFRARFVREAEVGPLVDHPNIVPIFDAGEVDGELYIAMRFVDGADLKVAIEQSGGIDPRRVLKIFRQVASALDAAHAAGVVHRDMKPQNILLAVEEDVVYVTDFGLVRPMTTESNASRTGEVFGSVQYMAPEQIEGQPTDGRTDVYALGCVLYECVTGQIPFPRENEVAGLWAHVHEDPPRVTDAKPELPGGLDLVVANALAKHPDDRYLTCGELVDALEQGLERKSRPVVMPLLRPFVARTARKKTEREVWAPNFFPELSRVRKLTNTTNWVQVVGVTAALSLLFAGILQFAHPQGFVGAVEDAADVVADAGGAISDVFTDEPTEGSPSKGDRLTRSPTRPRAAEPVKPAAQKRLKELVPPVADKGNDPDPGAPQVDPVVEPGVRGAIVWVQAQDTETPLQVTNTDLWVMRTDGSEKTRLTNTPVDEYWPSWSPDGRYIAYVRVSGDQQDIWVMNSDGTSQRNLGLCPGTKLCGKLAWAPDGTRVAYVQAHEVFVADLTSGTRQQVGRGARAVPPARDGLGPGPTWSPNGKLLAYTCSYAVCIVDANGRDSSVPSSDLRRLERGMTAIEWCPTGRWIAGEGGADGGGTYDIVLAGLGGSEVRRVSEAKGIGAFEPTWADDGLALAYADWTTGYADIYRVERNGGGLRQLTTGVFHDSQPDWWGPSS